MKLLALLLALTLPLSAAERAALLIGNAEYMVPANFGRIPAAVADLAVMKQSLLATGFAAADITVLADRTSAQMKQAVTDFAAKYKGTPEVLLYVSSHGLAAGTQNFLAGVDANLDPGEKLKALKELYGDDQTKLDAEKARLTRQIFAERLCPLSHVIKELDGMNADPLHCRIIILDACRTEISDIEEFSKAPLLQGLPEGFAPVEPPSGIFIGFAAKAGQVSISNEDRSTTTASLFTRHFATRITQPGTLDDIFRDVRNIVEPESLAIARRHPKMRITKQSPFPYQDLRRPFEFVKSIVPHLRVAETMPPKAIPASKTGGEAFTNTLGMKFSATIPGTEVRFCVHETRTRDFAAFVADNNRGYDMTGDNAHAWRHQTLGGLPIGRGESGEEADPSRSTHPVINISWHDAVAFCDWLSRREGRGYRLPTDREWSVAVGIAEESTGSPRDLDEKLEDVYPWDGPFTAAAIQGNYHDLAVSARFPQITNIIGGFHDGFVFTAPVMSFRANANGLHDMGGNVWEWCAGCYDGNDSDGKDRKLTKTRVLRGGAWFNFGRTFLLSSCRINAAPAVRNAKGHYGFRVVIAEPDGG